MALRDLKLHIGFGLNSVPKKESLASGVGAGLSILFVYMVGAAVSAMIVSGHEVLSSCFILISIAASSVLLFAAPHGALSQPWPLIGGHCVSALVGVTCCKLMDSELFAASTAVGVSVFLMSAFRCIHPPGGVTALGAVLGGEPIYSLGYNYVLFPVLFCAFGMLLFGVLFNFPFRWRLYPAHLFNKLNLPNKALLPQSGSEITLEHFISAVRGSGSYVDISEADWIKLFESFISQADKSNKDVAESPVHASGNY